MTNKERDSALTGAAVGAGAGLTYSYTKPSLPDKKVPRVSPVDRAKFISKLQPGDILLTGAYEKGPWEKGLDTFLNRNKPVYHVGVYTGKNQFAELLIKDQEVSRETVNKDMHFALREDAHEAWRPKITPKERTKFLRDVQKHYRTTSYDSLGAMKAWVANKTGLPYKCVGDFCSNVPAKNLPKRLFDVERSIAMPKDFTNPKGFEFVAELNKAKSHHLPASNTSLLKYVAAPAIALGALGFAYGSRKEKK